VKRVRTKSNAVMAGPAIPARPVSPMTAFGYESLPIRLANLQARLLAKAERRPGRAVD